MGKAMKEGKNGKETPWRCMQRCQIGNRRIQSKRNKKTPWVRGDQTTVRKEREKGEKGESMNDLIQFLSDAIMAYKNQEIPRVINSLA